MSKPAKKAAKPASSRSAKFPENPRLVPTIPQRDSQHSGRALVLSGAFERRAAELERWLPPVSAEPIGHWLLTLPAGANAGREAARRIRSLLVMARDRAGTLNYGAAAELLAA